MSNRVATVGRDGSRTAGTRIGGVPIWTGKVYEARPRSRDGVLTWRLVATFGGTRAGWHPSSRFEAELREQAAKMGYRWEVGVYQGLPCNTAS